MCILWLVVGELCCWGGRGFDHRQGLVNGRAEWTMTDQSIVCLKASAG